MKKFSLSTKLFEMDDATSDSSRESVIYISSDEEDLFDGWESDYSTDTEQLEARIEKEVVSSPMLIGGRIMTTHSVEEIVAGPTSELPARPLPLNLTAATSTRNFAMLLFGRTQERKLNYARRCYQLQIANVASS